MFRWLAVLRTIVMVNAVALNAYRAPNVDRPAAAAACVAVLVAWTVFTPWAYLAPHRRTPLLLGSDLAVTTALLASSPWVKGADFNASVPGFWIMGALFAWAVHWKWRGGLAAGVVLMSVDLAVRDGVSQTNYGNAFLLVLGGIIVGFLVESLQMMEAERDRARRAEVTAQERARLARAVHDGVLQVLALVQRRAGELGPDAAELARLAGEQEAALRTLIQTHAHPHPQAQAQAQANSLTDLGDLLAALGARPGVQVATPGSPVLLPAPIAEDLHAAVTECLANVNRHVGPGAPCWVLVEDFGGHVEVSIRDAGPGIPAGRLAEAAESGRLGVRESIRGRLAELGGTAVLHTGPEGTEWELAVPRDQDATFGP
jgi:signal transduction histidine kinase